MPKESYKRRAPLPLFDTIDRISLQSTPKTLRGRKAHDFEHAIEFLKCYVGSQGTFNSYRREIERILHWAWHIANKTLPELKRADIENYIRFCQKPLKAWIGTKKTPRFTGTMELREPNPNWRPFISTVTKAEFRRGERPEKNDFELSQGTIREIFAILSSFFSYMLQEEYVLTNPVALIRQKSKFVTKQQGQKKVRRLSQISWDTVIETAKNLAETDPIRHERTLFIMSALYSMYLRVSELAASPRWAPMMNDFHKDNNANWWFTTVGKGNKERQIAVSDAMLKALKRWRKSLGLSSLPTPADDSPLIPKIRGKGPVTSTAHIRIIVQHCFNCAIEQLQQRGEKEEAETLQEATVHWLRHTGISDDVKRRPREHVRDDAGHSSSAITDKYIDIELAERHRSAKLKPLSN